MDWENIGNKLEGFYKKKQSTEFYKEIKYKSRG